MRYLVFCLFGLLAAMSLLAAGPSFCAQTPPQQQPLQLSQSPAAGTPQGAAMTGDIRDIRGPVPLPDNSRIVLIAAVAIAVLLAVALLVYFLRRRRRPVVAVPEPDVVALAELDNARALMGQPLVYAERVSAILRQYIESRFRIRSTRQTTREFFVGLQNGTTIAAADIKIHAGSLEECMEQCDIAKFAHGTPNQSGMDGMDRAIRTFIEATRLRREPSSTQPSGPQGAP